MDIWAKQHMEVESDLFDGSITKAEADQYHEEIDAHKLESREFLNG